jgi:amino-acid N-acetyltransferase
LLTATIISDTRIFRGRLEFNGPLEEEHVDADWVIRPATFADMAAAAALLTNSDLPDEGLDAGAGFAIAEIRGRVVGVAGVELHRPFGLLRSVAVAENLRGSGLGGALVQNRLRWAADQDLTALYLLTLDAADYFKRFGFRSLSREDAPPTIRRSQEFETLCPDTATVMVRPVGSDPPPDPL